MTFPISSRSTQISVQRRFPVIEFEPLLDAIEAAALLRMHPNTLKKKLALARSLVAISANTGAFASRISTIGSCARSGRTARESFDSEHAHDVPLCAEGVAKSSSSDWRTSCTGIEWELWSRRRLPFGIPPSARSLLRGITGARRQLALLLRLHRPVGYGFRSKSCSQSAAKRFLRSLRKCRASALGAGPLAWLRRV